jgi:sugar/nucleoside kinase (ribokinase family)
VGPIYPTPPPAAPASKEEEDAAFRRAIRGWLHRHPHVRRLAVTSGPLKARLFHLLSGPNADDSRSSSSGGGSGGGGRGQRLVVHTFHLPFVAPHEIVNPIGAGDTCSAVALSAMLTMRGEEGEGEGEGPADDDVAAVHAFRLGLAAATASCYKEENSTYDLPTLWAVAAAIRIEVQVE